MPELLDEPRQSARAVAPERAEKGVDVVGLGEAGLVEAVGDGFDADVGGGDGFDGVFGGGDGGFDALGGKPLGELDKGVDVALAWVWDNDNVDVASVGTHIFLVLLQLSEDWFLLQRIALIYS